MNKPQPNPENPSPSNSWPFIVRQGHGECRVYKSVSRRGYETYFICWRDAGIRKRIGTSSPELAKQKARQIAAELSDGSARLVKVPLKDLLQVEALLSKLNLRIPRD